MKTKQKAKKKFNLVRAILLGTFFIILVVILWAVGLYLTKDYRHERYLTHINNAFDSYKIDLESGNSAIEVKRDKGCGINHSKYRDILYCAQDISFEFIYKENSYDDYNRVLSVFSDAGEVELVRDEQKKYLTVQEWIKHGGSMGALIVKGNLNGCTISSSLDSPEPGMVEKSIYISCSKEFSKPIYE